MRLYITSLLISFFSLPVLVAQSTDINNYLKSHSIAFSVKDNGNPLFDSGFYSSKYYFFGETHGAAKPQETDFELFTFLHKKEKIKHYIAEVDFTKAWLLNQFLSSGDTLLLKKVFKSWIQDTAQWANKEYYNKFIKLYQYQKEQPKNAKINIIGIDIPQDNRLLQEHILYLTQKRKFKDKQLLIDTLQTLAALPDRKQLVAFAKTLIPIIESSSPSFKKILGNDFLPFFHLIKSLSFLNAGNNRDAVMFLNFSHQIQVFNLSNERMYGFLGLYHCLQTSYSKSMPFVALLKKSLPNEVGITSFVMYTIKSKTMLPYSGPLKLMIPINSPQLTKNKKYVDYDLDNTNPIMKLTGVEALMEPSTNNPITLFKLNGANSPFLHSKKLAEITGFQTLTLTDQKQNTLDAFQYIILFRNAQAATPLEE